MVGYREDDLRLHKVNCRQSNLVILNPIEVTNVQDLLKKKSNTSPRRCFFSVRREHVDPENAKRKLKQKISSS